MNEEVMRCSMCGAKPSILLDEVSERKTFMCLCGKFELPVVSGTNKWNDIQKGLLLKTSLETIRQKLRAEFNDTQMVLQSTSKSYQGTLEYDKQNHHGPITLFHSEEDTIEKVLYRIALYLRQGYE